MPYDFSKYKEQTNEELASEIASLTRLTQSQIEDLLPKKQDKQVLRELINIVNGAATQNQKLATLRENMEQFGGVLLKILKTIM